MAGSDSATGEGVGLNAYPFTGQHLLAELYGVSPAQLDDPELLAEALRQGVSRGGATLCHLEVRQFKPHGVTVLALLAESHASIHSYPEAGSLFFDAFTCGPNCHPAAILDAVIEALVPTEVRSNLIRRGTLSQPSNFETPES